MTMQAALPKICPRCTGSMIIERDWYGSFSTCICCGYVREAVSSPAIDLMLGIASDSRLAPTARLLLGHLELKLQRYPEAKEAYSTSASVRSGPRRSSSTRSRRGGRPTPATRI